MRRRRVAQRGSEPFEVREIEIGGTYVSQRGKTFTIYGRTTSGKHLVGVTASGVRNYFLDDGKAIDGSDHVLRWYARSGPTGYQSANLAGRGL